MLLETPFEIDDLVRHKDWTLTFMVLCMTICKDQTWTVGVTDVDGGGWWVFQQTELVKV